MSAYDYGPSLSDQGYSPDDAPVGTCHVCGHGMDEGDMKHGGQVVADGNGVRLYCPSCAPTMGIPRRCYDCRAPIADTEPAGSLCGECGCEDDGDLY